MRPHVVRLKVHAVRANLKDRRMVYCPSCTKEISVAQCTFGSEGLTCKVCGAKTQSNAAADEATITNAVRNYTANASVAEREKKYGQQKWGLFETNYQRKKGITTEDSLREIEAAARDGITNNANSTQFDLAPKRSGENGTASADTLLAPSLNANTDGAMPELGQVTTMTPIALGGAAATLPSAKGIAAAEPRTEFHARVKGTTPQQTMAGPGAAFLAQYQTKTAAKFKPGYKGP